MTVNKKDIVFIFCMLSIFEPDVFKYYSVTDSIFIIMKFITLLIIGIKYLSIIKKKKFTPYVMMYVGALIVVNLINSQNLFFVIKKTIECILVCMFFEHVIYTDGISGVKKVFDYFYILFIINFILLIPFPKGIVPEYWESTNYKLFFLGIKNSMFNWCIIPSLLGYIYISLTDDKKFENRYRFFLIIVLLTILYTGSSTGTVLFLLWFLYYITSHIVQFKLSLKKLIPWLAALYVFVVILRSLDAVSGIIKYLFNKDATFSGRTNLWATAITFFKSRILWGYGLREAGVISFYGRSYTAHNLILEMLVDGGIFLFVIWLIMIMALTIRVSKCNNRIIRNHVSMAFLLFFISSIFGGSLYQYRWFAILCLTYLSVQISRFHPYEYKKA